MSFHDFTFSWSLVIDATQVQHTVHYHATQFLVIATPEEFGISPHSIEANNHVARHAAAITVVKRDDVGEVVMVEKFAISLEDVLIITEDIGQTPHYPIMATSHLNQPFPG